MNHPLFLILVVAALTGCAGHPALEHPRYAPTIVPAVVNESPATRGSSLYSTATEVMLFEDVKASRVGDIVSVLLAERTNASKSNDSSVTKSNEATIGNPLLGGEQRDVLGSFRGWDFNLGFGLESDQAFSGAGASNQSNQLTGTIAVTVVEELPRGNLMIQGEKWISLNQGQRIYSHSGHRSKKRYLQRQYHLIHSDCRRPYWLRRHGCPSGCEQNGLVVSVF